MSNCCIFLAIILTFLFKPVHNDVYTSTVGLEELIDTEEALISVMEQYIRMEQQKMDTLKRYLNIYKTDYKKATEDVELYISNPVNSFSLIRRLSGWTQIEKLITTDTSKEAIANVTLLKTYLKFPTQEDVNGAATGLIRLQHTYKLDTTLLARGEINDVQCNSELTAADCFELGKQCQNFGYHDLTQLWMEEADARLKKEVDKTVEYSDILEYLAYSVFKQGNIALAHDVTTKLLKIVPGHSNALKNLPYYEKALKKMETGGSEEATLTETGPQEFPVHENTSEDYEGSCRGEYSQPDEYKAKLKCRYVSKNNPFLKIAPFKVEEAHLHPEILIFHDILSDSEIEIIKNLALPNFERAKVLSTASGSKVSSFERISKVAWLSNQQHPCIADVSQRVTDMTGLSMRSAEELQVLNYGIGGYYQPHYDFYSSRIKGYENEKSGDRIATVLFYLSDVAQGGATVFPYVKAAIWPKKGTAVLWYNLHSSGHMDSRTKHAACPVLVGSKWVSTKWIHERYQEFNRPCMKDLPPEDTIFV